MSGFNNGSCKQNALFQEALIVEQQISHASAPTNNHVFPNFGYLVPSRIPQPVTNARGTPRRTAQLVELSSARINRHIPLA